MNNYTADELRLAELSMDSLADDYDKRREYQALRRKCARDRLDRRNPEWRDALVRAHRDHVRAQSEFHRQLQVVEDALGYDERASIAAELEREAGLAEAAVELKREASR